MDLLQNFKELIERGRSKIESPTFSLFVNYPHPHFAMYYPVQLNPLNISPFELVQSIYYFDRTWKIDALTRSKPQ